MFAERNLMPSAVSRIGMGAPIKGSLAYACRSAISPIPVVNMNFRALDFWTLPNFAY
jgi:hypothetical protein